MAPCPAVAHDHVERKSTVFLARESRGAAGSFRRFASLAEPACGSLRRMKAVRYTGRNLDLVLHRVAFLGAKTARLRQGRQENKGVGEEKGGRAGRLGYVA
jgi:hypothetical protein